LDGYSYDVYAKGSYPAFTNVVRDSDVDVAVELTDLYQNEFVHDAEGLTLADVGGIPYTGNATLAGFKDDVEAALIDAYGSGPVDRGKKAIHIRESSRSLQADVVLPAAVSKRPNLQGTWKAQLHFQWPDGAPTQTKDCFIVIRQTYSTVSVAMHFDISGSHSRSAAIVETNGQRSLWWSYRSSAHSLEQEGNPPHRGAAELVISSKPKLSLAGDYWTERKTRGRVTTAGHNNQCYDDYDSALAATYS
jgi:hypothetical protein